MAFDLGGPPTPDRNGERERMRRALAQVLDLVDRGEVAGLAIAISTTDGSSAIMHGGAALTEECDDNAARRLVGCLEEIKAEITLGAIMPRLMRGP